MKAFGAVGCWYPWPWLVESDIFTLSHVAGLRGTLQQNVQQPLIVTAALPPLLTASITARRHSSRAPPPCSQTAAIAAAAASYANRGTRSDDRVFFFFYVCASNTEGGLLFCNSNTTDRSASQRGSGCSRRSGTRWRRCRAKRIHQSPSEEWN